MEYSFRTEIALLFLLVTVNMEMFQPVIVL